MSSLNSSAVSLGRPGAASQPNPMDSVRPTSVKGRMAAEMWATIRQDPLSVQFLRPWIASLLPGRSPLGQRVPWMNFRVIRWLKSYLKPTMKAFEYGTGGSTIFLATRVGRLTSIEHDPQWHLLVARELRTEGITNCDLRLVPAEPRPSLRDVPYTSTSFTSLTPHARGYSFEAYVRTIDEQPDRSLDLVIVDGYARFSCVAHAIPKVRRGGYLLFDDTDWPKFREAVAFLAAFPRRDFVGATPCQFNLRQTSIWRL